MLTGADQAAGLRQQVRDFLAGHDPAALPRLDFLRARFDAGLAWVHYPAGLGGQGLPRSLQAAASQIPVRRIGQVEDVAHVISFRCSDGAGCVSGQVIYVAGGPLN